MEECENLCDRLTIMTSGQMKCIGTAQHLKQRYAQGFSILIKTSEIPDEDAALSNLKENMRLAFGEEFCNLKDEHKVGLDVLNTTSAKMLYCRLQNSII